MFQLDARRIFRNDSTPGKDSYSMKISHLLLFVLTLGFLDSPFAAPDSKPWERWEARQDSSRKQLNHGPWKLFLAKYLDTTAGDQINRVRYGQVSKADRDALDAYLAGLQEVMVGSLNRQEQKAFWINLYNAKTVAVVLRAYPVGSIRDIKLSKSLIKSGPWDDKIMRVEGIELSLNDIEHRILRPLWKDNRVHFALNCASLGCPNLASVPFTAGNSEALLNRGANDFIQSERGASFDGKSLVLSSIFDWYKEDFGSDRGKVVEFITRHSDPALRKKLQDFKGGIKYQYDWKLNDAAPRP